MAQRAIDRLGGGWKEYLDVRFAERGRRSDRERGFARTCEAGGEGTEPLHWLGDSFARRETAGDLGSERGFQCVDAGKFLTRCRVRISFSGWRNQPSE